MLDFLFKKKISDLLLEIIFFIFLNPILSRKRQNLLYNLEKDELLIYL